MMNKKEKQELSSKENHSTNYEDKINLLINRLTLKFRNPYDEERYQESYYHDIRYRSRVGSILIIFQTIVGGLAELYANPPYIDYTFLIRAITVVMFSCFYVVTYSTIFKRYHQLIMATVFILTIMSLVCMVLVVDADRKIFYIVPIIVSSFVCCLLVFTFLNTIVISIVLFLMFNLTAIILNSIDFTDSLFKEYAIGYARLFGYSIAYICTMIVLAGSRYLFELSRRKEFLYLSLLNIEREKYEKLAQHDALTGLSNRLGLVNQLRDLIENNMTGEDIKHPIGLLIFIDLNGFKPINDQYGHIVGDEVLKVIGKRLKNTAYQSEHIVARFGGDEFVIFLSTIHSKKDIEYWLSYLDELIAAPLTVEYVRRELSISVNASIGHSIIYGNEPSIENIIEQADRNMYDNKRAIKALSD